MPKSVVVIGLGSMGKRRIRLLAENFLPKDEIIGIDSNTARCQLAASELGIETQTDLSSALSRESALKMAFICTHPLAHAQLINDCLMHSLHVFTELNLVCDDYEKNILLAEQNELVLFMSSSMLYRKEVQHIQEHVRQSNKKFAYRYHVGQYLLDWHPWEKIEDFFVSNPRTNACREICAIELPWLVKAFGPIASANLQRENVSDLHLTYSDYICLQLEHPTACGTLIVDAISRKAKRELLIWNDVEELSWNGTPDSLYRYEAERNADTPIHTYDTIEKDQRYQKNIIENMYIDEIKNFLASVDGRETPLYSMKEDHLLLQLLDSLKI